ncbi:hypothetical protein [Arenicella xantha]|uniref:Uncharacterized protein n=1 Tax=Arenicella xantha TaxID=644221 RepID=A0A395JSH1_9GAMM|nr:hypothetical protein [Arenicella xantha]RBP53416.1 hypothetical protein DFR28_101802 [Arenicella xantha]
MKESLKLLLVVSACSLLIACGNGKRNIAMQIHSDPLGAYALMQVKHEGNDSPEWIFLGPTPVVLDKSIRFDGATSVTLKVIRPGFYEQEKTWRAKDFIKDYKKYGKISWVPNMVKQ